VKVSEKQQKISRERKTENVSHMEIFGLDRLMYLREVSLKIWEGGEMTLETHPESQTMNSQVAQKRC
jgi:hypothetical protein